MLRSIAVVAFCLVSLAVEAAPDAPLEGLWKAEVDNGPEVKGPLTITKDGANFSATIGRYTASVTAANGSLSFALPGDRGKFRGAIEGDVIRGFWIQPATPGFGVEHATPIVLANEGNQWHGTVAPLADKLTIYLAISRQADGSFSAFLRNPELNIGRGRALSVATKADGSVEVVFPPTKQVIMRGRYERDSDRLALSYSSFSLDLAFHRSDPATAVGFNERTGDDPFSYLVPPMLDDGWKTGSLKDADIDEALISALASKIAETRAAPGNTPYIDSLLIARHGKLAFEAYFDGYSRETLHTTRSAGKTFTSILLGAAIDRGAPISVHTPVYSLFPNYPSFRLPDLRKKAMTVENLLTMTSGLDCDDDNDNSLGNEDVMQEQRGQPDWFKYTLDLPMVRAPGEKAVYCSAGVNLVFGALGEVTHRWVPELFDEYLARPLEIRSYAMNLTPTEQAYGGGGIYLRPRDALKFGQLYLDGGVWNGKHVVSKGWVDASTTTHSQIHDDSTYGYNWWLYKLKVGDRIYDEYGAGGNGGQIIAVIPALDTVVAFNGANYGRFDIWYKFLTDLLPNAILPAVKAR